MIKERSRYFWSPERWPRRALRIFQERRARGHLVGGFCFGAFPLLSSERGFLYSHGQTAIRKRQGKLRRLHCDVFGSGKRNEHPQSTERVLLIPAAVARVRRSEACLKS